MSEVPDPVLTDVQIQTLEVLFQKYVGGMMEYLTPNEQGELQGAIQLMNRMSDMAYLRSHVMDDRL